jgi:membrane-associated protein
MSHLIDVFLHLDLYLDTVIQQYGVWMYFLLFVVVFLETGIVVTPFLPGDSLLFAAGALGARGDLAVGWLFMLLCLAAVLGDTVNYSIGHLVGPRAFHGQNRLFKREHLDRTHQFYERHGGKTIVLARFIPIIRTFAPFVAGIGRMSYGRFGRAPLDSPLCLRRVLLR